MQHVTMKTLGLSKGIGGSIDISSSDNCTTGALARSLSSHGPGPTMQGVALVMYQMHQRNLKPDLTGLHD